MFLKLACEVHCACVVTVECSGKILGAYKPQGKKCQYRDVSQCTTAC